MNRKEIKLDEKIMKIQWFDHVELALRIFSKEMTRKIDEQEVFFFPSEEKGVG